MNQERRPRVFIVSPTLNSAVLLEETIESLIAAGDKFEIFYHIQDCKSSDNTLDLLNLWTRKINQLNKFRNLPINFSFRSEKDFGIYDAIHKGFSRFNLYKSDIMAWLNAGDIYWPKSLDKVGGIFLQNPQILWITGQPSWIDNNGKLIAIDQSPRHPRVILSEGWANGIRSPFLQQESTFWRYDLWNRSGGINRNLKLAGDWDLWVRFALENELWHASRVLASFRVHPNQKSEQMHNYYSEIENIKPSIGKVNVPRLIKTAWRKQEVYELLESSENQWFAMKRDQTLISRICFLLLQLVAVRKLKLALQAVWKKRFS